MKGVSLNSFFYIQKAFFFFSYDLVYILFMHEIMNCVPSFQKTANIHKCWFLENGVLLFSSQGIFPYLLPLLVTTFHIQKQFWTKTENGSLHNNKQQRIRPEKKQLFDDETIDSTMSVAYKCSLFSEHENISSLRGGGGLVLLLHKKEKRRTNEGVCT